MSYVKLYNFQNILKRILNIQRELIFICGRTFGAPRWPFDKVSGFIDKMLQQRDVRFAVDITPYSKRILLIPSADLLFKTFSNVQQRIADDDSSNGLNLDDALFTSRETYRNA